MLNINGLSKTFNPGTVMERIALRNICLTMETGDFVTIIGGNGAGKSTLLNAIAGVFPLDSGHIYLDDLELTKQKEYQRANFIGHLFQDPLKGTAPSMTIAENLALAAGRTRKNKFQIGITKAEIDFFREKLAELRLGLEDRLSMKMGLLSGGQRQAVTLVMATIAKPKLLLLDEHTSALDPATADQILSLTKKMVVEEKLTTLMITHNIEHALTHGNRTLMMDEGEIVIDLTGDQREKMTIDSILSLFQKRQKKTFAEDRALFAK